MKHEFKRIYGETEYCGDAYCTGHRETVLRCVCGFERKAPYALLGEQDEADRLALIEHRLDVLEKP